MNVEQTLQEIRQIRDVSRFRRKKRKNQSKKDFFIQKSNYTCAYCHNKFKKEDLCFIHKNHTLRRGQIYEEPNNRIVACKTCSSKKGAMNHHEFIEYLKEEKKKRRQEIAENYPTYANKVFSKYNEKCIYCEFEFGRTLPNAKLTIDHKKAIYRLGKNNKRNLASACEFHNKEKKHFTPEEYFNFLERNGRKFVQTK